MESWKQTLAALSHDRFASLKRQAFLLCGNDGQAEDLVQDALIRAFAKPMRTPRPDAAEAYVRVIIVNLFIDGARRRSRWIRTAPLLTGTDMSAGPGAHPKAAHPRPAHIRDDVDHADWAPPGNHPVAGHGMDDQTGKRERGTGRC
ncbi:MAG TPA: sigma factor [Streptosporangiaceae bacterium]|nr:sigma factor [Streptosporangiaceae bacterium]